MKKNSRMMCLLCLLLLWAVPATAQHAGPYLGLSAGGNILAKAKGSDSLGDSGFTFKPALQGSAVLGWDFETGNPLGEGRIELEYSRRSNPLDQVTFAEGGFKGDGSVTAESLLLNFFGVAHDRSIWAPYAGGGIGAARISVRDVTVSGQPMLGGSATVLAYQLGCGIDVAVNRYLDLDLGYRFFSTIRPEFSEPNGRKLEMDYYSHSVMLGMRAGF